MQKCGTRPRWVAQLDAPMWPEWVVEKIHLENPQEIEMWVKYLELHGFRIHIELLIHQDDQYKLDHPTYQISQNVHNRCGWLHTFHTIHFNIFGAISPL